MPHAPLSHRPFDGFSDDAVDRFLAGESTPEEQERFRAYLTRYVGDVAWTELFVADEQRFASDVTTGNARARLEARSRVLGGDKSVRKAMVVRGATEYGEGFKTRQWGIFKKQPLRAKGSYLMAGVFAACLLMVAAWQFGPLRQRGAQRTARSVYVTNPGERATVQLLDGTTVALDVASRLEVPADYQGGNHTVWLTGAAVFTVGHQRGAPFTVVAGGATARVLGTTFVVRHFSGDLGTTVAVKEGKVVVHDGARPSFVLTSGRQIVVGPRSPGEITGLLPGQFGFVTGTLTLGHVTLKEAIPELDRWYDVDIQLANPALGMKGITGEYAAGSVTELANILELALDVRVERHGRVLTLSLR